MDYRGKWLLLDTAHGSPNLRFPLPGVCGLDPPISTDKPRHIKEQLNAVLTGGLFTCADTPKSRQVDTPKTEYPLVAISPVDSPRKVILAPYRRLWAIRKAYETFEVERKARQRKTTVICLAGHIDHGGLIRRTPGQKESLLWTTIHSLLAYPQLLARWKTPSPPERQPNGAALPGKPSANTSGQGTSAVTASAPETTGSPSLRSSASLLKQPPSEAARHRPGHPRARRQLAPTKQGTKRQAPNPAQAGR